MLYDKGKVDGALIIAPKGVVKTWYEQELPTHLPDHVDNTTVLWQANITKTQQEKLDELFEDGEDIVYYNDMVDCINKMNKYSSNDKERERIALNGYRKVLENHTQKQRVDFIIEKFSFTIRPINMKTSTCIVWSR